MKPKILMIIPGEATTNSFVFAKREVALLQKAGLICETYHFANAGGLRGFYKAWKEIRGLIQKGRFNIVHSHFGTQTSFLSLVAKGRAKFVVTFRGTDLNWSPSLSFARNLAGKSLSFLSFFLADAVVLVSRKLAPIWSQYALSVIVIPSGVDTEAFYPIDKIHAQEKLGWDKSKKHLLLNVGGDPLNKRLDLAEECVKILGVTHSVELHVMRGGVAAGDVVKWINAADIVLMLSDKEGSPTIVQEALACGVAILSVDVGDCSERLAGVRNARIVSRSPVALAKAAIELFSQARGINDQALEEVRLTANVKRLTELYHRLAH